VNYLGALVPPPDLNGPQPGWGGCSFEVRRATAPTTNGLGEQPPFVPLVPYADSHGPQSVLRSLSLGLGTAKGPATSGEAGPWCPPVTRTPVPAGRADYCQSYRPATSSLFRHRLSPKTEQRVQCWPSRSTTDPGSRCQYHHCGWRGARRMIVLTLPPRPALPASASGQQSRLLQSS
jgi:hypothetical protein